VNSNTIVAMLARFNARTGPTALLRLLGFDRAPAPCRLPAGSPRQLRSLQVARRTTLCAYTVRLRTRCTTGLLHRVARLLRAADPVSHRLLVLVEPRSARIVLACDAVGDAMRSLSFEPQRARPSDIESLTELLPVPGESDTAAALRIAQALDRSRVTTRFFRDVTAARDLVARSWTGPPATALAERDALALLLLSRLLFLYFLQRRGLLAGDARFLPHLLRTFRRSRPRASFYTTTLDTLFFGVLNRRREGRTTRALALGELPYLNGGLFERHAVEQRWPGLDVADDVIERVFDDLLEKYRFTAADAADDAAADGIDPEMLGRIFEGLMPGAKRARTGTFYTPSDVVQRVARETLAEHLCALCDVPRAAVAAVLDEPGHAVQGVDRTVQRPAGSTAPGTCAADVADGRLCTDAAGRIAHAADTLRVLDPACGSGAFLLGALHALGRLTALAAEPPNRARRGAADGARAAATRRRAIVASTLYGVDLLEDAALICSLRLWLSLVPQCDGIADVPPLPNLDRRIRQGDALVDPLDIGAVTTPARLRPLLRALEPVAADYLGAGPETRGRLRRELQRLERQLARCWLDTLQRSVVIECRELEARAHDRDLFGEPARHATLARRTLPTLRRRIEELNSFRDDVASDHNLPFFSFRIHFAEAADGFDVVLSNPPWIRSHNWPPTVREVLRERYAVCRAAGWPHAADLTGSTRAAGAQVDLSLLFLERGIRLLAPGGTLGMLLPAKLIRSLYAGGARALLLRTMHVVSIEDHSLDQRAIFDADAFTAVLIARRPREAALLPDAPVRVRVTRPQREELRFELPASALPLRAGDDHAPWLIAPPACAAALRTMQRNAVSIGEQALPVRRGAMTGANDVLLVRDVEPKIGDLARIRTDGWYRARPDGSRADGPGGSAHGPGGRADGRSDGTRRGAHRGHERDPRDGVGPSTGTAAARRTFSALVEASALRPALRGTDIQRWSADPGRHVIWVDASAPAPPRLARFLGRHRDRLAGTTAPLGALQRVNEHTFGHKVVWSDLAADLRAAAVQPCARSAAGCTVPLVPLNTVYFVATASHDESLLLAAYLNSLPVRTFARAVAERAKDAHFRFFAWTIAVLPLPRDWRSNGSAAELRGLSAAAHTRGRMTPAEQDRVDALVAQMYGLDSGALHAIAAFDRWLS
jgi:hypothetical protein